MIFDSYLGRPVSQSVPVTIPLQGVEADIHCNAAFVHFGLVAAKFRIAAFV